MAQPTQAQIRSSSVNEMDFCLDAFNNQKVYVGAMAYAHKIKNLLLFGVASLLGKRCIYLISLL